MTRAQYKAKYYHYLNSVQWRSIRDIVLLQSDYRCRLCGVQKMWGLHVHHTSYAKWFVFHEYRALHLLIPLCSVCHESVHRIKPKLKQLEGKASLGGCAEVEVKRQYE